VTLRTSTTCTDTKYFYYDTCVFRTRPNGIGWDRWHGGEWKHATGILYPSFEEYLHLQEITEQEAHELCNAEDIYTRWLAIDRSHRTNFKSQLVT
jgi:hypothetical protein